MQTTMLTRPIPSTAEPLPVIGLGSYQTFDVGAYPAAQAGPRAVMQSFVDAGGALIDSSPMYGNAETAIGNCMAALQLREKCFIATKVWTSGRDAGIRQMQESS